MNEKVKKVFKTIGVFLAGVAAALIGFFVRRRDVSDIRRGIDSTDEQLGRVGNGIGESEETSERIADLVTKGKGIASEIEHELRESSSTAGSIAESVDRQSVRIADSKRIIDDVKKRGKLKSE